ncbi:NADPH:quinone oxidoreductase family protein [Actinomadura darangshiensis]|uniref:NADPH:quinone oxidoreductase family protein n=1 Tax=Actinomadura darangshiensis TaxID=705336 RepID=A0A4R5C4I0_9ACTN|nr:NADPH:quinone oxidoreductase family protein [Actinomadura darangshiensis]TDD91814.1 NADPH:quinone oxidoreductase family protein [Actinomadura darangshiensis]
MRALRCAAPGSLAGLRVREVPEPVAGPGQVVVEVRAAAVNFADILVVQGAYQVAAPVPFTPGSEFAGRVTQAGPGVEGFAPGDAVSGAVFVGAFAQRVLAPATSLTALEPDADFRAAAASGVSYATAHHALTLVAELHAGETLAVLGAAGGVGLAAVQLGRLLGARVIAVASSARKRALCLGEGADAALPYDDLKRRLADAGGADVVLDPVGGEHAEPALRALRWGGRYVTVGYAGGEIPRIPLNLVLLKGISVRGFEFGGWARHDREALARSRAELARLFLSGGLEPHVHAVYPLEDAAGALAAVAGRGSAGKVLIVPAEPEGPGADRG